MSLSRQAKPKKKRKTNRKVRADSWVNASIVRPGHGLFNSIFQEGRAVEKSYRPEQSFFPCSANESTIYERVSRSAGAAYVLACSELFLHSSLFFQASDRLGIFSSLKKPGIFERSLKGFVSDRWPSDGRSRFSYGKRRSSRPCVVVATQGKRLLVFLKVSFFGRHWVTSN